MFAVSSQTALLVFCCVALHADRRAMVIATAEHGPREKRVAARHLRTRSRLQSQMVTEEFPGNDFQEAAVPPEQWPSFKKRRRQGAHRPKTEKRDVREAQKQAGEKTKRKRKPRKRKKQLIDALKSMDRLRKRDQERMMRKSSRRGPGILEEGKGNAGISFQDTPSHATIASSVLLVRGRGKGGRFAPPESIESSLVLSRGRGMGKSKGGYYYGYDYSKGKGKGKGKDEYDEGYVSSKGKAKGSYSKPCIYPRVDYGHYSSGWLKPGKQHSRKETS